MSLEPQTTAKVQINTTKGSIIVELWAKETPNTSRLFLENALNQRFNGLLFNRIVPKFLIQTEPTNDSSHQEVKLSNEYHPRIRFNKRGLLGSVNEDHSQFFITLDQAQELNNKNTLFGKIVDDSIFTALKISEGEVKDEKPLYPTKILSSEVLIPYFDDLKKQTAEASESQDPQNKPDNKKTNTNTKKRKINVKLTLFQEEGLEDEGGPLNIKMKSAVTSKHKVKKQKTTSNIINPVPLITRSVDELLTKDSESEDDNNSTSEDQQLSTHGNSSTKDTLELLNQFESNLKSKSKPKSASTSINSTKKDKIRNEQTSKESDHDSDFDNLSESDNSDDDDLFTHELKFKDEITQDDLMTIDTRNT
ncbi:hypothetical protein WICPIJ_004556 [Wickerhamomyces pijperi]|uniref:PPIase cyclophilin-type domain-containing protein n=1 Tax=Wickerhamomyces pijperi TaxID=599730 RepID=A0A9P8Q7I0_WICPI|nr:hypothetical protein WICPIJ_004556 [Wickerhamomyces pijperi]